MINFPTFFTGIIIYIVGTASPGPANLSIANAAMNYGRKAGLMLATGVISGSLCWGALTGVGISARSAEAFFIRTRCSFDLICAACYILIAAGFIITLR